MHGSKSYGQLAYSIDVHVFSNGRTISCAEGTQLTAACCVQGQLKYKTLEACGI